MGKTTNQPNSAFDFTILHESKGKICEICQPLFKASGLSYFHHSRVSSDGSYSCLSNNPEWLEYLYPSEPFQKQRSYQRNQNHCRNQIIPWTTIADMDEPQRDIYTASSENFFIDHGITIVQKNDGYCDFFHLGTDPENSSIWHFYINHIKLIENFITFYKKEAYKEIKLAQKYKTHLAKQNQQHIVVDNKFKNQAELNSFDLLLQKHLISQAEIRCAKLLLTGMTAQETADALFKSRRTIEKHIQNLKDKFDCSTLLQLGSKLDRLKLLD